MEKIVEKIGLIGVGNMGASILEGVLKKGIADPKAVCIYDAISKKIDDFAKKWNVIQASSSEELVSLSDIVLLAVKPQDFKVTAEEMRSGISGSKIVMSILAGMPIARIQDTLGKDVKIVRAMPNLGARVGEAITALTSSDPHALALAEALFSGCGKTANIKEDQFDLVTAISGSGPAYFFYLIERLAREGESKGLSKKDAELLATQTALGAAQLVQHSSQHPEELRKMVTSKGGTTEAALKVLMDKGFEEIFGEAIEAARKRGQELSEA